MNGKTYRELTDVEKQALRAVIEKNKKRWRVMLSDAWQTGAYWKLGVEKEHYGWLQGVRNSLGPSWLYDVFKPEDVGL